MPDKSSVVVLTVNDLEKLLRENSQTMGDELIGRFSQILTTVIENISHPDILIPRKKAIQELDICEKTAIAWERKGILKPVYKGHLIYYRRSDLLETDKRKGK